MVAQAYYLLKTARPRQWLKNLAIFAPLTFSGELFDIPSLTVTIWAFIIFCSLSSAVYIINDFVDRDKDRQHPFKRFRPLAAGKLRPGVALTASGILLGWAISTSIQFRPAFVVAVLAFVVLQISYSFLLKKLILIDVIAIAASFLIRVYAGTFIIASHVNVWFLLAVLSLSLFLAIGKRRSELTILHGQTSAAAHRATLQHYPESLLSSLTTMFATASWLTYALFTFNFVTPRPTDRVLLLLLEYLPSSIEQSKWLMITVPFVIYGVMRYLYIIFEKKEGESPERILLGDKPLLAAVITWVALVILVLYGSQIE